MVIIGKHVTQILKRNKQGEVGCGEGQAAFTPYLRYACHREGDISTDLKELEISMEVSI